MSLPSKKELPLSLSSSPSASPFLCRFEDNCASIPLKKIETKTNISLFQLEEYLEANAQKHNLNNGQGEEGTEPIVFYPKRTDVFGLSCRETIPRIITVDDGFNNNKSEISTQITYMSYTGLIEDHFYKEHQMNSEDSKEPVHRMNNHVPVLVMTQNQLINEYFINNNLPKLSISLFQVEDLLQKQHAATNASCCNCPSPRFSLEQNSLLLKKQNQQMQPVNSDSRSNTSATTATTNDNNDIPTRWVDLRLWFKGEEEKQQQQAENGLFLPSLGSVTHFLRSLLGTHHQASPWLSASNRKQTTEKMNVTSTEEKEEKIQEEDIQQQPNREQQHNTDNSNPQLVFLVLPLPKRSADKGTEEEEETDFYDYYGKLINYRLSDAAPSWYLHTIMNMKSLPIMEFDNDNINSVLQNQQKRQQPLADDGGILFIYKQLPTRDLLQYKHPITNELSPNGCLWESYCIPDEEKEDEADENQLHQQQGQRKKNNKQSSSYYRIVCPPSLGYQHIQHYKNIFSKLLCNQENYDIIRKEGLSISQWIAWPEKVHYQEEESGSDDSDSDDDIHNHKKEKSSSSSSYPSTWTVFPLCHCFPANDITKRKFIKQTCDFVPQTTQLLKSCFGDTLRTALFSRLDKESVLQSHIGWEDLANHVIRCHIPISVPRGDLCGVWVDGVVETHTDNNNIKEKSNECNDDSEDILSNIILFDDSKIHRAFNYSKEERVVLIVDLAREETFENDHNFDYSLPVGTSVGGHSEELDNFIEQMNL